MKKSNVITGDELARREEWVASALPKNAYDVGIGEEALAVLGENGIVGAFNSFCDDEEFKADEGSAGKIEATHNETGVVTMLYFRRYKQHIDIGTRKDMADLHLTDLCDELDAEEANDETAS